MSKKSFTKKDYARYKKEDKGEHKQEASADYLQIGWLKTNFNFIYNHTFGLRQFTYNSWSWWYLAANCILHSMYWQLWLRQLLQPPRNRPRISQWQ